MSLQIVYCCKGCEYYKDKYCKLFELIIEHEYEIHKDCKLDQS